MALKNTHKNILLAMLSGVLMAFAFPKINMFYLAWVALIPLVYVIMRSSLKESLLYGFIAGFTFFVISNYWLIPMLSFYSSGSFFPFFIFSCFLWVYFASYWVIWSFFISFIKKYFDSPWIIAVFAACAWTVFDFIKTYVMSGLPWMLLGFSQYNFTSIIQISEFTGMYGVSFVIVFFNMLLYFWLNNKKQVRYIAAAVIFFLSIFLFGVYRYNKFVDFGGKEYKVAIVQSNIEQERKLDTSNVDEMMADINTSAEKVSEMNVDLVLWSESEFPELIPVDVARYFELAEILKKTKAFNVIGSAYLDGENNLYNGIFSFEGGNGYTAMHLKNHLVPFGEYVPYRQKLSQYFDVLAEIEDLLTGADTNVFTNGELYVGAMICSENFFPYMTRRFVNSGAKVLTNHANDAWFLDTPAPYQHFLMNVFRAIESRKAVLVSANTGVSAIIEPTGKIKDMLHVYKKGIINGTFSQNDYKTFYIKHSDIFVKICVFFMAALFGIIIYRRKYGSKTNL